VRIINNKRYYLQKKLHKSTKGYYASTLSKNNKKSTRSIHQLVAEAFLNHIPDGYNCVINHIDNDKLNNKLDNLEIVSSRYNSTINDTKKNVGIYERNGKFEARIVINNKMTALGTFSTLKKALEVRNNKVKEIDTFIPIRYIPKKYTYRLLLQIVGTDVMRDTIHPNGWVNSLMSEYKPLDDTQRASIGNVLDYTNCPFPNWIITDLRFSNELEAVKNRKGISIRINRPKPECTCSVLTAENCMKSCDKSAPLEHISETALDNAIFDYTINNNGSIEELIEKVKEILIKENII
jgi:hypothetical protein